VEIYIHSLTYLISLAKKKWFQNRFITLINLIKLFLINVSFQMKVLTRN